MTSAAELRRPARGLGLLWLAPVRGLLLPLGSPLASQAVSLGVLPALLAVVSLGACGVDRAARPTTAGSRPGLCGGSPACAGLMPRGRARCSSWHSTG
jgi:hypothetical protein